MIMNYYDKQSRLINATSFLFLICNKFDTYLFKLYQILHIKLLYSAFSTFKVAKNILSILISVFVHLARSIDLIHFLPIC